jgi:hypothetical protein
MEYGFLEFQFSRENKYTVNNSLFISMCILRDLPQQKNPRESYVGGAPTILYVPMEIFLFYKMGKKQGNTKRVVYVREGSCTCAFS